MWFWEVCVESFFFFEGMDCVVAWDCGFGLRFALIVSVLAGNEIGAEGAGSCVLATAQASALLMRVVIGRVCAVLILQRSFFLFCLCRSI